MIELQVDELGPSLKYAAVTVTRPGAAHPAGTGEGEARTRQPAEATAG